METIFETDKPNMTAMVWMDIAGISKVWRKHVTKITYDGIMYFIYSPDGMTSVSVANAIYLVVGKEDMNDETP